MNSLEEIYSSQYSMRYTSINLISFGYFQYKQSSIVKKLDVLSGCKENISKALSDKEIIEISYNSLIDSIRITILIENYLKAFLLSHGYSAHLIKQSNENTEYRKLQFKQPFAISNLENILINRGDLIVISKILESKTIGLTNLLHKEAYKKFFKLPLPIYNLIERTREARNKLHFYTGEEFVLSRKTIEEFEYLEKFTSEVIVKNHNELCKACKAPNYHYIIE